MNEWTPEAIAEEIERRRIELRARRCPDSGQPLLLDNPFSDSPLGRLSCEMCDCFGYDPCWPLEYQAL